MIQQRLLFSGLFIAAISIAVAGPDAVAGDYVWARTGWGSSGADRHYSSFSNGYGGFYVPRNAYGNNHESRGRFTNPNGYIVPAQSNGYSVPQQTYKPVLPAPPTIAVPTQPTHVVTAQPTPVQQSAVPAQASKLVPNILPPRTNSPVPNSTIQTAPALSAPAPSK